MRTQDGVSRRDIRKKLVFHFNSHFLSDFSKLSVVLAVSSISSDSRIVRESPPVSFQAETSSNVSDWRVGSKFSLSFQVSSSGTGCFRRPFWASLLPEELGLRFVLLYLSGGPGADALGHPGSLPGCAEHGLLFPEGGKVVV